MNASDKLAQEAGDPTKPGFTPPKGNSINPEFFTDLIGLMERYAENPPQTATLLNMNPYELRLATPSLNHIIIPACGTDEDFVAYQFRAVDFESKLTGDDTRIPIAFEPIVRARAYVRYQEQLERFGVVMFLGDKDPYTDPKIQADIAAAKAGMVRFAKKTKRDADNELHTPNRAGVRNIGELHRGMALLLYRLGEIDKLPEWMDVSLKESSKGDKCPGCGTRPERDAMKCSCGWILDVEAAWLNGLIEEDNVALRRLSREKLEELNISDYVSETLEERNVRLSEEAQTNPDRNLTPAEKAAKTRAANKAAQQQQSA